MAEQKGKKSKYVFAILRILVVVGGLIWAIIWFSSEQRWKIFLQMNIWVFAGTLVIFSFCQVIVGLRWWLLLRSQSIFIPLWVAVRLHFLGLFYNNCMPGSVGGDLVRAWYVTKHTDKKFEAALSVFVDRTIGLLSTLIIAVFFYLLFLRGSGMFAASNLEQNSGFLRSVAAYKGVLFWVLGGIIVVFCMFWLNKKTRLMLAKVWSNICGHGMKILVKFKDAIIIYCSKPLIILAVFALTVFVQLLVITSFWLLGLTMGIEVSVKYYYVFFTLTWVLGAVPVSIGGAVVVEFSLASLFINFVSVAKKPAFALALCQRVIWILTSLPGAVIHLFGAHLPKDFSIDYDKPIN